MSNLAVDLDAEYGWAIEWPPGESPDPRVIEHILRYNANRCLPEGIRYEIRKRQDGRGMCWYSRPHHMRVGFQSTGRGNDGSWYHRIGEAECIPTSNLHGLALEAELVEELGLVAKS